MSSDTNREGACLHRSGGGRTDEVKDDAAVAGPAGGAAEEGLAVGEVVERNDGDDRPGQPDEVAGVDVGVAEAEYGGEEALGPVAGGVRAVELARDEEEQHGGGGGDATPHGCGFG